MNPTIYRVLTIQGGAGFRNHPQYVDYVDYDWQVHIPLQIPCTSPVRTLGCFTYWTMHVPKKTKQKQRWPIPYEYVPILCSMHIHIISYYHIAKYNIPNIQRYPNMSKTSPVPFWGNVIQKASTSRLWRRSHAWWIFIPRFRTVIIGAIPIECWNGVFFKKNMLAA